MTKATSEGDFADALDDAPLFLTTKTGKDRHSN